MKHWKAYPLVCAALLLGSCSSGQTGGMHAKASPTVSLPPPWPLLLLGLTLLLLSGCADSTAHRALRTPPPPASVTPLPMPNQTPLDLQHAWGRVTIRRLPSALVNNRVFVFDNAAAPDGQWLLGCNEPL